MVTPGRNAIIGLSSGLFAACLSVALIEPASAQGLFEMLFGGLRRAIERPAPPAANAYSDPFNSFARTTNPDSSAPRGEANPSRGFCVRTCDGHYFPVRASGSMSAADGCRAMCPAADTRVYSGSNIDYAVARDGSRYANLKNAYAYREKVVDGCTCNGRTPFGLAHIDVSSDPTLRPGDIVATQTGLVAYNGGRGSGGDFTPVQSYAGFPKSVREQLSHVKIMSTPPQSAETTSSISKPAQAAENSDQPRSRYR